MNYQEERKFEKVLFSSASGYDSGSEDTFKRSNCGRRRRGQTDRSESSLRDKFMLEEVHQELSQLQMENAELRQIVIEKIEPPQLAEKILRDCEAPTIDIFLPCIVMENDEAKDEGGDLVFPFVFKGFNSFEDD